MEFRTKNKLYKKETENGNGLGMIQIGKEDEKYKGYEGDEFVIEVNSCCGIENYEDWKARKEGWFVINRSPSDNRCECCMTHISNLENFDIGFEISGVGVVDIPNVKLVKNFREVLSNGSSWECKDCIYLNDNEYEEVSKESLKRESIRRYDINGNDITDNIVKCTYCGNEIDLEDQEHKLCQSPEGVSVVNKLHKDIEEAEEEGSSYNIPYVKSKRFVTPFVKCCEYPYYTPYMARMNGARFNESREWMKESAIKYHNSKNDKSKENNSN